MATRQKSVQGQREQEASAEDLEGLKAPDTVCFTLPRSLPLQGVSKSPFALEVSPDHELVLGAYSRVSKVIRGKGNSLPPLTVDGT